MVDDNKLYYKYEDNNNDNDNVNDNNDHNIFLNHYSVKIKKKGQIIKLIESCEDGNIRIWNFHTGELMQKFKVSFDNLFTICFWKDEYLFIGCGDFTIKLLKLENGDIIEEFINESMPLILRVLEIPKYGECLVFQDNGGKIKLRKLQADK